MRPILPFMLATILAQAFMSCGAGAEPRDVPQQATPERAEKFRFIAKLQNPDREQGECNTSFRSVAVRCPWVYALATGWALRGQGGRLSVFEIPLDTEGDPTGENEAPKVRPVSVIEDIGDGGTMVRWDDLLVCGRHGGLEVYSLAEPRQPKRVGQSATGSKKKYATEAIVRDGNRAYLIGYSVILCYDLSDPLKPKCIGETATDHEGFAGCVSNGYVYVAGGKKTSRGKEYGVAVFDASEPAAMKEIGFVPVSRPVYHVFVAPGNRLLASMDGDQRVEWYSPPHRTPFGKLALLDITDPARPSRLTEIKNSGARSATICSTDSAYYFVCQAAIFAFQDERLEKTFSFWDCGSTLSGFPYRGDSDGRYVALPNDEAVVLIKRGGE